MTERNEMVERVARALDPWAWDEFNAAEAVTPYRRQDSLNAARAAIAALEPTAAMKAVGNEALLEVKPVDYIYRAMNAEALKP